MFSQQALNPIPGACTATDAAQMVDLLDKHISPSLSTTVLSDDPPWIISAIFLHQAALDNGGNGGYSTMKNDLDEVVLLVLLLL